ncbi:hypothetical protein ABFX02_05G128100 [Erythranthe guttata]
MDNSTKKSSGIEIPKRNRSLDLNSIYKSRVSGVGEDKKKVSEEKDQENVKKKRRRSTNDVSSSGFESDTKKMKKEDVGDVKSEQGFSEKASGGSKGLHGTSVPLGESGSAFNFPKRPRDLIGRKKLVADHVSKPFAHLSSIDRAAILFNERFNKSTRGKLVKSVTPTSGNDGASKSNYAGKIGGSNSKVNEKVEQKSKGVLHSTSKQKSEIKRTGFSDQASKSLGLVKSVNRAGAFNGGLIKPKDNAGIKDQLDKGVAISEGNNGNSPSIGKQKADLHLARVSDRMSSLAHPSTVDRAGAFISKVIKSKGKAGTSDHSVKLITASTGNDGASNPKFAGKNVSGSNSKVNQKEDLKPNGGSNSKRKQKEPKSTSGSDRISAALVHPNGEVIKPKEEAGTISAGNDDAPNPKLAGKVSGSNSKVNQKADTKPKGGSNSKRKQKEPKSTSGSDRISEAVQHPNGEVIKSKDKAGTRDQSANMVTIPEGNGDAPNSQSMEKVDGSKSKVNQKAHSKPKGGSNSKRKVKAEPKLTSGSDPISEALEHLKSVDRAGASNGKFIKPKEEAGTMDQPVDLVTASAGNDDAPNSKSAGKNGGLKSKVNQKTDAKPKGGSSSKGKQKIGSDRISDALGHPNSEFIKPKDKADTSDQLVKLAGASISKSLEKVGCSSSKVKPNVDPKSTSKSSSGNGKRKRKAGADGVKENVDSGQTSCKKRRIKSRKKDLVIGEDGGEASKKKPEPLAGSTVSNSIFIDFDEDDDDEENLEQNAARMLSSRFDPSCTGFSSKRKSPASQTVDGFSFPVSSNRDLLSKQANSSSARKEDKGKGTPRKRRHFYDVLTGDLDPHWFFNRRIKVFWPLDECWYYGLVDDYNPDDKKHHIKYDDRDEEWIDLQQEKFKLLLLPTEAPGKVKSKKVSPKVNDVRKGQTVPSEDDASCRESDLDSEPIALWLARSSQHGKSLPKSSKPQRALHIESPTVSALPSEKNDDLNSNFAYSRRTKLNPLREPISPDDLALHAMNEKSLLGSTIGSTAVYARKKNSKKGEVTFILPTIKERNFGGFVDYDKQLWSTDRNGLLRLNVILVESKEFRFRICLPVLRVSGFTHGNGDFELFRNMLMPEHGVMSVTSPAVIMEMLFIDSYLGLKFLLFEGCMEQALAYLVLVMTKFSQSDEHVASETQSPVTSVRLRLSSVHDARKHRIVGLHSFARLQSSKWARLDFELLRRCALVKQLQISECTYDNIKELEYGSLKQRKPHVDLELPSYMGFNNKFVPHILPTGVSEEACNTRISQSASFAGKPGKVPKFALSSSDAPTFFLIRHLHLLIGSSSEMGNLNHRGTVSSHESSDAECTQSETSLVSISKRRIRTKEIQVPAFKGVESSNRGFSNGPKRPRTQVQYTLPFADFNTKQKRHSQRDPPCKRIRRASLKRISDGSSRSNEKNFELLSCGANVLVTHEDKGWRECGAVIILEVADHNEWRLAIKLSGVTKYSYKVKNILQPGSTNRYSHAMLWKGGKDWVLEFPDRSQWNLFKEMHEECYNRNIRAASVKSIPIPGVWRIEECDDYYKTKVPFIRNPMKYFRQDQTDVEMAMDPSHILYDIDSDDERWLTANKKKFRKKIIDKKRTIEDFFEKTMDMFEKFSFVQHRDNFTDDEVQELVTGMGSVEAAKVIYEHWREKRGRKGMPLIRHLQPPLWERYQQQLKEWEHDVNRSNPTLSIGVQKKAPAAPEKPAMFAFCLKPRGLEIRNKFFKHRSHKKFSISAHLHSTSRDHNTLIGRRSSRHTFGDDANTVRDARVSSNTRSSKAYKNKRKTIASSSPSFNNQSTQNGVRPENLGGAHTQQAQTGPMDGPTLHEFQVRETLAAAARAKKRAKLKKERAYQLSKKADYFSQKAAGALLIAEAVRDSHNSNEGT